MQIITKSMRIIYKINADNLHKDKDKQLPSILPKFFTPFFNFYHPFHRILAMGGGGVL